MYQMFPTIYYFFWVRYHPGKVYSQKKSWSETKYRPSFLPTTKPHPLNPFDRGPTSLVLAGYRLVVLWPLCACFTIFSFCLLLFPRRFYRSRLVLFCFAACLCLISSRISCCVCHFLQFDFSFLFFTHFLLLTLPVIPYFFSSYFFILVFTPVLLYKRIWAFVGQIMLTSSKGSQVQFILICQSHSTEELYFTVDLYSTTDMYSAADLRFAVDCSPQHFFLWIFLALQSSWWIFGPCFSLGFLPHGFLDMDSQNWASIIRFELQWTVIDSSPLQLNF